MKKVTSFLNEQTSSINKNFQLAQLSGITRKMHKVTTSDLTLYDYDSGGVVILGITGGTDVVIDLPAPTVPGLNFTFIAKDSPSGSGDAIIKSPIQDTISAQTSGGQATFNKPVYTLTFSAAFVASNVITCSVEGDPLPDVNYASSSDNTLQALATKIASAASVESAVVTVEGGNQTGTDDRNMIITGANPGVEVSLSGITVTGGVSQASWDIVTNIQPIVGAASGAVNLLADNVKLETAALGGEWIEFVSDGEYWYCRSTAASTGAITLNG
jgi:hypothetical protein